MACVTPKKRGYQPPRMGEWHDSLDDIEPEARPERPPEPPPGSNGRRRRKRAVARRSQAPVAPGGGYYYWCEHCDYCNLPEQGRKARCSNHERQDARTRKARQRQPQQPRTADGDHLISDQQLRDLRAQAHALLGAARTYDRALHLGNSTAQKRRLDDAIRALADTVTTFPRPDRGA